MFGEFVKKCRPSALGGPGTYCNDAPLMNAGTPQRFASISYPLETRDPGLGGDSVGLPLAAADWIVALSGGGLTSVQAALDAARPSDRVLVRTA